MAQRKHSNGNQHNLVLNFSFVLNGFLFVFSLRLKLPYPFLVEAVGHNSTPTLHCILLCPFPSYFVVPVNERESVVSQTPTFPCLFLFSFTDQDNRRWVLAGAAEVNDVGQ